MNESEIYTILFVEDAALNLGKISVRSLKNPKFLDFLNINSKIINPVSNKEITKIDVLWAKNCYDAISKIKDKDIVLDKIDLKKIDLDKINLILMDFDLKYVYEPAVREKAKNDLEIGEIIEESDVETIIKNKVFCKNPDTMDDDDKTIMKIENNGCNTARNIRDLGYKGPIIPVSANDNDVYLNLFKKPNCGNWFVEDKNDMPKEKVNINYVFKFLIPQLEKYYKIPPMLDLSGNPLSRKPIPVAKLVSKAAPTNIDELLETIPVAKLVSKAAPVIQTIPAVMSVSKKIASSITTNIVEPPPNNSIKKTTGGKKTKKLHKKQRKTKKRILGRRRKTNRIK